MISVDNLCWGVNSCTASATDTMGVTIIDLRSALIDVTFLTAVFLGGNGGKMEVVGWSIGPTE